MSPKYKKTFGNVIIGAALFWILGFLADIIIPLFVRRFGDPSTFYAYEGVGITIASCVSGAAVAIALIVCLVKSKKETAQPQTGNETEEETGDGIAYEAEEEIGDGTADEAEEGVESGEENEHPE